MMQSLKLRNLSNFKKTVILISIFMISIILLGALSWTTKKNDSIELQKENLETLNKIVYFMAEKLQSTTDNDPEKVQLAIQELINSLGKVTQLKSEKNNLFFIIDGYNKDLANIAETKAGSRSILRQVDAKYQPLVKKALGAMQDGKLKDILVPIVDGNGQQTLLYGKYYQPWNSVLVSAADLDLVQKTLKDTLIKTIIMISIVMLAVILFSIPMVRSLVKGPKYLDEILRKISQGDLSVRSQLNQRDESGKISDSVNILVENFGEILRDLNQATNSLASQSEKMSSIAMQVGQTLTQQAQDSEQASTAMNEISYSIGEIAQNAITTNDKLNSTKDEVKAINVAVYNSNLEIDSLTQEIDAASNLINRLSHETEQIGNVLNEINGISEQTNLLALNAAIEAARAGEAGRGFAVVADEVRALAVRTSESTAQISEMNAKLNQGTTEAVKAMTNASAKAKASVASFAKIKQTVENIGAVMEDVEQNAIQVSVSTQEQSRTVEETSRAISEIATASEDMYSSSDLIRDSSEELQSLVRNLETKLGNFRF